MSAPMRDSPIGNQAGTSALVTILNGVLLNVMPEITVAFALAALAQDHKIGLTPNLLTELINFGFSKSGIPVKDKFTLLNQTRAELVPELETATTLYNRLRGNLTGLSDFAPGALTLLRDLKNLGVPVFTTSVVPQTELDTYMNTTSQGKYLTPLLQLALGANADCTKLLGHLKFIKTNFPKIERFYLLFDAPAEVALAAAARAYFELRVVGFAVPICSTQIKAAITRASSLPELAGLAPLLERYLIEFEQQHFLLPSAQNCQNQLQDAGADAIITAGNFEGAKQDLFTWNSSLFPNS